MSIPPVFGPTDPIPGDEDNAPFATVGLQLIVSREQLRAALAIGHAEQQGQPALTGMDVLAIRREVEGHLGACTVIELDREADGVNARLSPEVAAALDAAIERAYTRPEFPRVPQTPVYGDGTVTLQTLDHGEITIEEPAWCVGHGGQLVGSRADITHDGRPTVAELETDWGPVEFLRAHITHAPFLELRPELQPTVSVEDFPLMDPPQLRQLAAELALYADRLRSLAAELENVRRAES